MHNHQNPPGTKNPPAEGASRRPRFQRSPKGKIKSPTEFDREIFRLLEDARFLSTDEICGLLDGEWNRLYIQTRLTELFHDGWIDRPDAQHELQKIRGTNSLILAIGPKAARDIKAPIKKNRGLKTDSLVHDHMIGSFYVRLLMALGDCAGVELTSWEREPKGPAVSVPEVRARISLSPDAAFVLERENQHALFFLEAETGTIPGWRSGFKQSSYWRKICYYTALCGEYQRNYERGKSDYGTFVVLTVLPEEKQEHLEYLMDLCREHDPRKRGRGIFWFAFLDEVLSRNCLADPIWRKANLDDPEPCAIIWQTI